MAFGLGGNTAQTATAGFRSGQGFGGFNVGNGLRSGIGNMLKKEFSYSEVFGNLVQFQQTLSVFDWNATDEELRRRYEGYKTQMASQMGALVGRGIGSTLAVGLGGAAGLTVPKISSGQLAKRLIQAGSEQAREEIIEEVEGTLQSVKTMALNAAAMETYINIRKFLKGLPRPVLEGFYGKQTTDFIKNTWGEENADTLILQEELEERIESLANPQIRAFVEEAVEEFFDSIIETGFIIAGELDSALREFQLDRARNDRGDPTIILETVEGEPNSERFIIQGNTNEEIEQEVRTTLQQWRIMQNRSMGQIITQDIEILEQHPQLRRLEITFRSKPFPPFVEADGTPSKISTLTIPNFKHPIRWQEIKRELRYNPEIPTYILGDSVGLLKFTDKRKIRISYNSTQMTDDEVENLLKQFADLSDSIIKTITTHKYLEIPRQLRDDPIGMYPISCKIVARNLTNLNRANANRLPEVSYEFPLWTVNEPPDFDEFINTSIPIGNP